jgi:hypothetical protein
MVAPVVAVVAAVVAAAAAEAVAAGVATAVVVAVEEVAAAEIVETVAGVGDVGVVIETRIANTVGRTTTKGP